MQGLARGVSLPAGAAYLFWISPLDLPLSLMTSAQILPPGEKACIIGAGISGLTAAKALRDRNLPYDQFEMGSDIGGLWRIDNDNGRSAVYRTLHINSSRFNMELEDFPMPDDFPVFPHHTDVLQYFESYADRFDLRDSITFTTRVDRVEQAGDGAWDVILDTGERRRYGAVVVANGHHWDLRMPDFHGSFAGRMLHSHDYTDPETFSGKRVCVVGIGNSGCDIAVDLSRIADDVILSTRSSAWILPKYILGRPLDQWTGYWMEYLPLGLRKQMFRLLVWLTVGDQERYGVPKPDHELMEAHPTISQELLSAVGHGRVRIKPDIHRLDEHTIHFENGSRSEVDAVICATGYNVSVPFLPDSIFRAQNNHVELYHHVVPPRQTRLFFVGLLQPLGSIMPLSERPSKWVAGLLDGEVALPDRGTMQRRIREDLESMHERYTESPRHTLQVDFWRYVHRLEDEWKEGKKRADEQNIPRRRELDGTERVRA